ncbi:hypothetical protein AXX17_AT4G16770 [Arabidopsis thaliana]|uniref:Transmembrane protein n=1 Tax=Arabidopsis thaliana TaxID=3702 RepID=A0A178UY17_ARATH|nr:hypothetical protein AXX17_AT4G16770 [Arabidopsis thaliana]
MEMSLLVEVVDDRRMVLESFNSIGSEVSLLSFFSFDFFLFWYDLNHIFFQWFKI